MRLLSYRFPDKGERVLEELPKRAGKPVLYAVRLYGQGSIRPSGEGDMEDEDAGLCSH